MGEGLDESARDALEQFADSPNPEAQRRLSEALGEALGQLSPAEREALAERLREAARRRRAGNADSQTAEDLSSLAERLDDPAARAELLQQLQELARSDPGPLARREDALGVAQQGSDRAQSLLSGVPIPVETPAEGTTKGMAQSPRASGTGSPSRGGAHGNHGGETPAVDGDEIRAKARARMNLEEPLLDAVRGRAPAQVRGTTAAEVGIENLPAASPETLRGMERTDIPAEYREQVGRYFSP
jgi:hypothetical protein